MNCSLILLYTGAVSDRLTPAGTNEGSPELGLRDWGGGIGDWGDLIRNLPAISC